MQNVNETDCLISTAPSSLLMATEKINSDIPALSPLYNLKEAKLLLVDDDALTLEHLELVLSSHGYENLVSTTDPDRFTELVEQSKPDLVMLDLHMPRRNGFDLLAELRHRANENAFLPVIVLTSEESMEAKSKALDLGAMDYLHKPYIAREVLLRTNNLLQMRRLQLQIQAHNRKLDQKVRERTLELESALQKMKTMQEKLLAQERMRAMGQMAGHVAHDFNNSVAVIMGNAELLISFPEIRQHDEKGMKALKNIQMASKDAASVVRRLREFYKSDANPNEEAITDLKHACKDTLALTETKRKGLERSNGCNIKIQTRLESVSVGMPLSKIREILTNLIFNSLDAMPKGGELELRCHQENNMGVLEVRDSGEGMTEKVRNKCLEMFFSTKGANGTGLGLNAVSNMVQNFRGKIDIDSEVGKGTTISVRLPVVSRNSSKESDADYRLGTKLRILMVGNEPSVTNLFKRHLELDGHEVTIAVDGRTGLVEFFKGMFDLVVTDQAMPGVTGAQLARTIHAHSKKMPIIMLSDFGNAASDVTLKSGKMVCEIEKPVEISSLRKSIFKLFSNDS